MRFLVDMSVDIRVAEWLRHQGHHAVHLRDEGLQRMPNGEIFEKALREDRIVLTSDLDFGEIAAALKSASGRVLLLRLQNARAANVTGRLASVLPLVEADLAAGAGEAAADWKGQRRDLSGFGSDVLRSWGGLSPHFSVLPQSLSARAPLRYTIGMLLVCARWS